MTVAGVLLAMRTNFDPSTGPLRLIFAFEAVIIGGLGNIWGTLVGGLLLGVAQAIGAQINPAFQILAGHAAFLLVLIFRPGDAARDRIEAARRRIVNTDFRWAAMIVVIACAGLAAVFLDRSSLRLLTEFALYLSLATLWNMLAGYAGLVSIGQQAFVGLGGYCLFALVILGGWSPLVALPIAAVAGGALAAVVAPLLFRLHGHYFTIGTWVIAEIVRVVFAQASALGGGSGASLPIQAVRTIAPTRPEIEIVIYALSVGLAIFCLAGCFLLLRSRVGLALRAIRDNAAAAAAVGVSIQNVKWAVFVGVGALTALVGALIFVQKLRISPDAAFSINDWTALVIFMVVIGGIGRLEGPIIGTILFFVMREHLADLGSWYLILLGLVSIAVMLFARDGLFGLLQSRFGVRLFDVRRPMPPPASSHPSQSV